MPLNAGTRLGPYEILSPLGAGGMGEVYRARDTRLQRQVAVKIVPAAVAGDPEALGRFEREAQAVAALSHPNILAIHDFGEANGVSYAVMELLEGRSLAEVLATGPVPPRKTIDYAKQIADGLAAAHERGIVHRDLKPGNIFVNTDGRVTILDFGLARMTTPEAAENSPTVAPGTTPGLIMGTAGYMSPEQVRGAAVDYRSDIFAFGAVLYEMVSGRRAFKGATPADTMSAILNADPDDFDGVVVPPALDRIIRRCLEKEANRRFQSTRDLGFALDSLTTRSDQGATPALPPTSRSRLPWIAAACLIVGATIGALLAFTRPPTSVAKSSAVVRFQMPSAIGIPPWIAVSPTGESVAWGASASGENAPSIFVRHLNQNAGFLVPGSSDAFGLGWQSGGRQLLIAKNRKIISADIQSGLETPLYDAGVTQGLDGLRGTSLGEGGQLLIAGDRSVFLAVLDQDDPPKEIARPESGKYAWYGYPQWFPGGRILYMAQPPANGSLEAFVRPIAGGAPQRLDLPAEISHVIVDPLGNLVYARNGTLLAQPFDFTALKPTGEAITIATEVVSNRLGTLAVDLGPSGVLAYRSSTQALSQFEWVSRTGATLEKVGPEGNFTNFDLTADGMRVVVLRREALGPFATTLWLIDGVRQIFSQVASSSTNEDVISDPAWSPDGQRLAYRRADTIVVRNTFGGEERKLADWRGYPDSWSRDGRYLAVGRPNGTFFDLVAIRVDGPAEEIPLVGGVVADEPRFSPDGKWIAYHATAANTTQVYVMPFPPTGEKFQVSTTSGVQPRWRGDGAELFFLDLKGNLVSVELPGSNPRQAKTARVVFHSDLEVSPIHDQFAPSADGSKFLLRQTTGGAAQMPVNIILNWRELLK
jgi:eukaryotic-like serine/threonine-protein kinase